MRIRLELSETVSEGMQCKLIYDVPLIHQPAARSLAKHGGMNLDGIVDYEWIRRGGRWIQPNPFPDQLIIYLPFYVPSDAMNSDDWHVPNNGELRHIVAQIEERLEEEDRELRRMKAREEALS